VKRRVGIIGMGWVGSSVAISTLHSGVVDELLVHDLRAELAEGEAMDLAHGALFYSSATVRAASIEEIAGAEAVVIAAGRGGQPNESRLDLLRDNAATTREIGRRLAACSGSIVMVTNPVDVLTRIMVEASGLPASRVIGTGTMLDTARLREALGREFEVDPRSVHAQVVGEHGDSSVALWSGARVGGLALRDWRGWTRERETRLAERVRGAAYQIIRRKGATNHAIGLVTAELLRCLLRDERRVLTVSRVQDGALGLREVALSLPCVVGAGGAAEVLEPELSAEERAALERSAAVLRSAYASLGGPA
jgi:L-lactate dehydrogenase